MLPIPQDFPVQPLADNQAAKDRVTCGSCGRSWDDAIPTSLTPAPSARCPFEYFHTQFGVVDPVGEFVKYGDQLGEIVDVRYDSSVTYRCKVKHFNGTMWTIEPILSDLKWIQQDVTSNYRTTMDAFLEGYLECALWSSTDDDGNPLDDNYGIEDLSIPAYEQAKQECHDFQMANEELLEQYSRGLAYAGHDFWLTRNRHGSGFWDRGEGAVGDALTEASHMEGDRTLYAGDDGRLYFA